MSNTTNERLGQDLKFKTDLGSGQAPSVMGDVDSADLTVNTNLVEVNNDSTGNWMQNISAKKDWSISLSVDLTEHDTDSGQADLIEKAFAEDTAFNATIEPDTPAADDVSYSGEVLISSFSFSKSTDDIITADLDLTGNGELVRSVTSST